MKSTSLRSLARRCLAALAGPMLVAMLLASCGGGVGEEGTGIQPASASVGQVQGLSDNSVTVDGVNYRRSATSVVQDGFGQPLAAADLRLGMWVEVIGTLDDSGTTGIADSIRVRPAARGVVSASGPGGATLEVFGSTVHLAAGTVLDGTPDAASLQVDDVVEVHGPLSSTAGDVNATRVEKIAAGAPAATRFELRGRVSLLDPTAQTMVVGRRAVSYRGATLTLRQALAEGQVVRVSAAVAPGPKGTPWIVDRLTSDVGLPANLGFLYTEGFVEQWQPGPTFVLEDLAVDATSASGKAAVQADGLRVAVVGALVDGALKAKAVAVVQPGAPVVFTLSGKVTDFASVASFRLRGVLVDASAATFVAPAAPDRLVNEALIRVKGTVQGRRLIASQVEMQP